MASNALLQTLASKKDNRLHFPLTAINVANDAGSIVEDAFYKLKTVSGKSDATDLVTETDKAVEKYIFDSLKKEFPSHSFLGEESVSEGAPMKLTDNPTWIVDPIDGTTNFVHMNPYVAVSIGLVITKKSEVAVVLAPILKNTFVGVRGEGAYLNEKRLRIENPVSSLSCALLAAEWGASRDPYQIKTKGKNFINSILRHGVHGMRNTGSAALNMCMVANNSVDLYFEWGPHCWDAAAACLLMEEAGGVNSTTEGKPFDLMGRTIISATSKTLIDELVPTLTQIPTPRDDD